MSKKRFLTIRDVDNQSPLLDFIENDPHLTPLYFDTEMPSEEQTPNTQNTSPQIPSLQMSTSSSKNPKQANKRTSDVWLWFTKYELLHPD
ncbi:hypothetical protein GIB67_043251 [Kingdonia uniflora]|uniref:Uncharacterized protein n=1 Tax=Kingdonia uniflora TaxID=39325 RepID=A0A7J7L2S2_9MAGN|nr:hypothetical protein GIB67_043251 [Kingdonia uniflora]